MQNTHKNIILKLSLLAMLTLLPMSVTQGQEDVVAKTADGVLPKATETDQETKTKVDEAQETVEKPVPKYDFTIEYSIPYTNVKSQDSTGTRWSFATASFIESELIRQEKGQHDLSEMFIVKNI